MIIEQAIEKLIPNIASRIARQLRRQYELLVNEFGPSFQGIYNSERANVWRETIRPLCDRDLKLSDVKVDAAAQAYAEAAANEWREKITAKLGDIEYCDFKLFGGGDLIVHGTRAGHFITLDQEMIFKQSTRGKLFNQYPSRIYVDGKFVSEKQYKEMW